MEKKTNDDTPPLSGGKNVLQILMKFPVERVDRNLHSHQINSNTSTNGNVNHRLRND